MRRPERAARLKRGPLHHLVKQEPYVISDAAFLRIHASWHVKPIEETFDPRWPRVHVVAMCFSKR